MDDEMELEEEDDYSRVGFIDVLTGFLCSAALLMIIIAYSQDSGQDIAGGPRDYLYYQAQVSYPNNMNVEDARLQFYVKTPNGNIVATQVTNAGTPLTPDLFHTLSGNQDEFYIWGPSYQKGKQGAFYTIYGVSSSYLNADWGVDALYYDHRKLEDDRLNLETSELNQILETKLNIKVFAKTLADEIDAESDIRFADLSRVNLSSNDE